MKLNELKNQLIVSCQALPNEPLHGPEIMQRVAIAAMQGGAGGIRANTVADINAIKAAVDLPVIGIIKQDYPDSPVYITPTMTEVQALVTQTTAEIIAIDATQRAKPQQTETQKMATYVHEHGRLAMADISTIEEGLMAAQLGFDLVSTTMSGYTDYTESIDHPDFELVRALTEGLSIPVIMEGHTTNPQQVKRAFRDGAFAVVVGGAITRPQQITRFYVDNMK